MKPVLCFVILFCQLMAGCKSVVEDFPAEMTDFVAYKNNPVFQGGGHRAWDQHIRERGFILKENDGYHLWYTGYNDTVPDPVMYLGYATSQDGIEWQRHANNPIFTSAWVEDMMVIRTDTAYLMFAEGKDDIAHMLSSRDKVEWQDHGPLQILYTNGEPLTPGPYGTPTVFLENGIWHLFYERNDEGIWLALSDDLKIWKHVQDEPVLKKGPEPYDRFGVAVNQIVKYNDRYYAYYHGTAFQDWREWSTNVAVSKDLREWKKYPGNPILGENKSSGILVQDAGQRRFYTMHPAICLHYPSK